MELSIINCFTISFLAIQYILAHNTNICIVIYTVHIHYAPIKHKELTYKQIACIIKNLYMKYFKSFYLIYKCYKLLVFAKNINMFRKSHIRYD